MKENAGSVDRTVRITAAFVVAILFLTGQFSSIAVIILGLFFVILLSASFVGFCPLYIPLKLATMKGKKPRNIF